MMIFISKIVAVFLKLIGKNYVLVHVDGGVCSQIHFFIIGTHFEENGYKVRYNTNWFSSCGMDMNEKYARNFDILKLNPNINFKSENRRFINILYAHYLPSKYSHKKDVNSECSWQNEQPPVFLGDYYRDTPNMYTELLPKYFKLDVIKNCLDERNNKMFDLICSTKSVAMHVRRGDLANYNSFYGNPCSITYFYNAVNCFDTDFVFYIFSDDPEWCKTNLLEELPKNRNYKILDLNGSDKGYMDLVLMAACSHSITSKGSLGKYSACINNYDDRIVVLNNESMEHFWGQVFKNAIFIDNEN